MKRLALLLLFLSVPAFSAVPDGTRIEVRVSEQKLYVYDGEKLVKTYPVSTSKAGTGNKLSSGRTPLGKHRIKKKIGGDAKKNTIFENRVNTQRLAKIEKKAKDHADDVITSRILWLEGLEPGVNRGGHIDSFRRLIYIHGTAEEGLIGKPASHGCVRMKNADVIDLFDRVDVKTPVTIYP